MKQVKFLMCVVVLAFSVMAQANTINQERLVRKPQAFINTNSKWQAPAYLQMENGVPMFKNVNRKAAQLGVPSDTVLATSFGFLEGPNGEDWLYTQEIEFFPEEGMVMPSFIKSCTINFYDGKQAAQGTIKIDYPEKNNVNKLEPYGIITNKFFDTNENTYEVLIYEHQAGNEADNYIGDHKIYVYNTKGEKLNEYDGQNGAVFTVKTNNWTSYDRFLLMDYVVLTDTIQVSADSTAYRSYTAYTIDIYSKHGWNGQELLHHIVMPEDKIVNHVGSFINTYEIEGKPYYTLSFYEKPFYTGEFDENWQMVQTKKNNFIVEVYNQDFEKIDSIKIPVAESDDYCHMYGFGFLTYDDLSKNYYTKDNTFNFLITVDSYDYLGDSDKMSFYVYNNKGEKIKTLDENVDAEGILMLDDIEGHETQWAFGHTAEDGTPTIRLVNIPSCEVVHEVTPTPELPLSFTLNRYADGDSYQYVSFVNTADLDEKGNVISRIGWYNQDLTVDHFVRFNLGKNGIYFTPHMNHTTLNPYFFNTNDAHEYVYLSYVARESGTGNDTYLTIADNNGETIKTYVGDDTKGDIITAGFLNAATSKATMYIGYTNLNTGKYTIEFIKLPLTKFAGGNGTQKSPYIVNTYGDLQQIANSPAAHYIQGRSIDMGKYAQLWKPIEGFSGSYDGQNYSLENMTIADPQAYYVGLFGDLEAGANVSNLYIKNPIVKAYNNNQFVSVLAGGAQSDTITNIHVYNANIIAAEEGVAPTVGGIISFAASFSTLDICSFNEGIINLPAAENVGGIVGDARTSTLINACAASGSFTANNTLGGILGSQGAGVEITNCHANVNLKAENTIGGIVGENGSRSLIKNNLVEGTIVGTAPARAQYYQKGGTFIGGVVGSLSEDWNQTSTNTIILGNVVALTSVTVPDSLKNDPTINAIAGYTIQNADDQPTEAFVEKCLAQNYTTKAIPEGNTIVGDTTVNGALKELSEMNKEFFTSLGFVYGDSVKGPWVDGKLPHLYIEKAAPVFVLGVSLDIAEKRLFLGTTEQLTATVNPAEATNQKLIWSTSDDKIATVDANGLVKAIAKGTAIITVTTEEGGYSATCNIIVYDDTAVENVEANSQVRVCKVLDNGTIYIIRTNIQTGDEERFMIDGRKVK